MCVPTHVRVKLRTNQSALEEAAVFNDAQCFDGSERAVRARACVCLSRSRVARMEDDPRAGRVGVADPQRKHSSSVARGSAVQVLDDHDRAMHVSTRVLLLRCNIYTTTMYHIADKDIAISRSIKKN